MGLAAASLIALYAPMTMPNTNAVVITVDAAGLPYAAIAAAAARSGAPDGAFDVLILTEKAPALSAPAEAFIAKQQDLFTLTPVDWAAVQAQGAHGNADAEVNWGSHWSSAALWRLSMQHVLPAQYERVLYIDYDTALTGSVEPLFRLDMSDYPVAAVDDLKSALHLKASGAKKRA